MNILVIGSGGREHALAWKLAQAEKATTVFVAPGNAGTALEPSMRNVDLDATDFPALIAFVEAQDIAFTMVGPEAPLVDGIVDYFTERKHRCFGPSAAAAQLEGSKAFTKDFLERHKIPTAAYATFTDLESALSHLRAKGAPIVVKADGLAAGKGVVVATSLEEAEQAVTEMLSGNAFGEAGCRVVIEEFLEGEEASFIVVCDGKNIVPMATSQDHKRIGDGDQGPNTGGMGAYSPAPVVDDEVYGRVMQEVIEPTVRGMSTDGNPYVGFLYAGLMIGPDGAPKVIEFNCRFGDPETQPIMMRLNSDLLALCEAAMDGKLDTQTVSWDPRPALGVVMAAGGYPGGYSKGLVIQGLADEEQSDQGPHTGDRTDCKVFHAGTRLEADQIVTNGGRVLCVAALGETLAAAQRSAYARVRAIHWPDVTYRKDIGWRALERDR